MKKLVVATLLSSAIATPSMASSSNELSDASLIFNMENDQAMELAVLSSKEMKETEGAYYWFARPLAGGLLGGLSSYTSYGAATGDWISTSSAMKLWTGFAGGAIGVYGGWTGSVAGGWLGSYSSNFW